MEKVEQTGSFTIACRYVPYDQWFVTHAHPGWKVKRLKESIIAKALNLPFDRRLLEVDIPVIRPPSPITFAPDETERPISPIKFARRPVALKKSRATISLDSSTDREVVADKDEVSGGEGGVPVEQEDARTSEGSETLIAEDEDDDRMDAISFDSGDGYEEDDESDDGLHPLARTRTPTGGRVYVPPIEIPGPPGGSLSALSPSQPSGLTSIHIRPRHGAPISVPGGLVQSQQAARDKEQIYTAAFTFVRYSTGQVLEDDFNVGWYNLLPNELLEVHSSSPPLSFLVSAFLSDILTKGGSHSIQGLVAALANGYSAGSGAADATALSLSKVGFSMSPSLASSAGGALGSAPTHGHSSSVISSFMNGEVPGVSYQSYNSSSSSNAKKLTVSLPLSSPPILTSLPRQDTQAYIQPYWEGWVRVLRVVYRPELDAMAQYSLGGFHGSGGGNPAAFMALGGHQFEGMGGMGTNLGLWAKDPGLYVTGADLSRQHDYGEGGTTSKRKTKMEWRDRWVVIRDGMVFLCKDREDSEPTHRLPLSSLTNLRGADHLANNVRQRDKPGSGKSRERSKNEDSRSTLQPGGTSTRPSSSRSTGTVGAQSAAAAFTSNPVLSGGSPRRSTSISANSSSISRTSTRRGTVSGAPTLDSTSDRALLTTPRAFSGSVPSSVPSNPQTIQPGGSNIANDDASQSAETDTPSTTPRPGLSSHGNKLSLPPLILPSSSTLKTSTLVSASAPISPVSPPLSPAVTNKYLNSSSTSVVASTSKSNAMSPVSSSASTLLAENSSGRREGRSPSSSHRSDKRNEERSRHHSSKDPKAPRSKAVSLERDQKTPEQREKERKRRQRDRELAKEAAADLEYIQKWDDLGFSFGKKGKDKDKDKGKVDKGKEKEKKSMKLQETGGVANKDREKEKARDREKRRTEREMESDAQRQQTIAALGIGAAADGFIPHGIVPPIPISSNADSSSHGRSFSYSTIRQRNQASLQHPPKGLHFFDKTYIPGSNEEAENIGMRIVCAKFRVEKVTKATDKDPAGVVASSIKVVGENGRGQAEDDFGYGYLRRGDKDKEKRKKLEKEKKEQKGKEKTKFNEDMLEDKSKRPMTSSQHILNLADASISRGFPPRKASLPGLSLGFGSGKDKEKEKDKWAERSLEKAAKQKQKDRKKKKDHDNSGEDAPGVTGSGLSWKLGKKRKQAIDSDTEKDKSTTATEDDDGQTDDGIGVNDSGFRTTPQVRVQVQVETKAEGDIPKRPRLTVSTATIPKIAPVDDEGDDNVNLSSPVFAHSTDSDESEVEFGLDRRRGYRYGGYHEEKMKKQQQRQTEMTEVAPGKSTLPSKENTAPKSPSKRRDNEKYEWIVLDMGSLAAYNSILRIFHRHFKPPMHSVFINTSPAVQGQPGAYDEPHYLSQDDESSEDHTLDKTTSSASHHPSALKPTRRRRAAATLALPYPEWRNQTVSRARSQGMLETGRPIELAMNRWGRDYELMTQEFRRQKERDSEWRRKFRQSYGQSQLAGDRKASIATIKVDKGKRRALELGEDSLTTMPSGSEEAAVEDEQDDDDAYLTADPILLDDSEEESEEEFARWWRDVPRQIEAEKERHLLEKQRELLDHENDSAGDPYDDLLFERRPLASSSYSLDPMLSTSSNLAGLLSTSARQPAPIFIKTTGLSAQINQQATPASPTALTPTPSTLKSPDTLLSSASTEVPIFGSPILSSAYSDGLHNFHSLPSLTAVSEDTAAPFISKETPASRFHEVPPSRSPQQERGRQFRLIRNLEPSAGASASSNTERGEDASSFDRESVKDRGENRLSTQSLDSPTAGYQFPPPKNISSYVNGQDLRPSSERTHDHKKLYEDDLQGRFYPRKASTSSSGHSHLSYEEESTISGHSHTRSGSLHHSVSRPSSSTPEHQTASSPLRNLPTQGSPLSQYRSSTSSPITSSLFGSPRARERTVTLPTNFGLSMAEMAIALGQSNPTAQVQRPLTGAGSVGIGDDNLDKPILTPEQIRQIENETLDAWVPPTEEETMIGLTITPTRSTPPMTFGSSSPPGSVGRSIGKRFPLRGLAGVRTPVRSGHASGSERDSDDEKVETVGGSVSKRGFSENAGLGVDDKFKNGTWAMFRTASNPTSPATATITPDHPWNSSVLSPSTSASNKISAQINQVDSQSAHAKDILRRVRSGSSLHLMPMGVHLELEENLEGEPPFSRSIMVDDDDSQGEEDGDDHGGSTGHDGLWLSNNDKWKHSTRNGEPSSPNDGDGVQRSASFRTGGSIYTSANGHGFIG